MALTLQEISDRIEIADTTLRYAHAVDQRDWSAWDTIFAADAVLDYTGFGFKVCDRAEWREQLRQLDPVLISAQHLILNQHITIEGDAARSQVDYHAPGLLRTETEGEAEFIESGGLYLDRLRRTADGWRIVYRYAIEKWSRRQRVPYDAPLAADRSWSIPTEVSD